MKQVFEAFRMCIPLGAFHAHVTTFQDVLRLLPTPVTVSNEVLLIRTLNSRFDVHEGCPKNGLEQDELAAVPSLQLW